MHTELMKWVFTTALLLAAVRQMIFHDVCYQEMRRNRLQGEGRLKAS